MKMERAGFGCCSLHFGCKVVAIFCSANIAIFGLGLLFHMTKSKEVACCGQSKHCKRLQILEQPGLSSGSNETTLHNLLLTVLLQG